MENNVDADAHMQKPVMERDKKYDTIIDMFQDEDEDSIDASNLDGFAVSDGDVEVDDGIDVSVDGNQWGDNLERTGNRVADAGSVDNKEKDENNLYDFLLESDQKENDTTQDGNTEECEKTFEEIEEWEEITDEEEVTDEEENDENEEEDEGESNDDEDEEDDENSTQEDDASEDLSQLGACGYESDQDAEKCYICLVSFRDQDVGTPESCDHMFCLECILEWSKHVNTCPVDRTLFHSILVRSTVGGNIERNIEVTTCNRQEEEEDDTPTYCEVCGCCDREDRLLLCDGCDNGYHLECLDPPLEFVPVEEWYCPECAPKEPEVEDISEEEEQPVRTQPKKRATREAAGNSQPRQGLARAIARTRVSELVVARISEARALRLREQGSSESTGATTFKRTRLPRVQMKKTRKKPTKRRRKRKVKKKVKVKGTRKKGRKVKKKVKRIQPVTVKTRIAGKLGLVKARTGSLLPDRKVRLEPSLDNQRAGIGAAKLTIFGGNELTEISANDGKQHISRPNTSQLLPSVKAQSINTSTSSVDLLSSIMQGQELLHTKCENVTIHRDGTLTAIQPAKESSPQKKQKPSTSSEEKHSPTKHTVGFLSESHEKLKDSYNVCLPPDQDSKSPIDDVYEMIDDDNTNESLFDDDSQEMKPLSMLEMKGKRAAARELATQRAAEREEEVRHMKERRKREEEFNDEMEWDIQTPFSVAHKVKDDSKLKDTNVNGTKTEDRVEEESQWVEVVHKKEEEKEKEKHVVVEEKKNERKDEHHKGAPSERDGKEHREGTLTCRASTSSFESHSETEERYSRKSTDDKRKRSSRHSKSKRSRVSHTSGSTHDSSAEEGEVKSDEESKGRKVSTKKSKKTKRNVDRDTRNVVVNDYKSDPPRASKVKQDSRRVEDHDRYDRGSSYNDLRHVIQVKRNYENPRYEMYWDDYNRKWVDYRPEWTSSWEQHRTYEQQMYAADWGRQNSANSHRYLKERSWENFTVKRERSPIFDRRKSREKSSIDKRDTGWETTGERDRRSRDRQEKDRKDNRHDRKRYSQTTTRSNSSGTDYSQSKKKSRERDRDSKDKHDSHDNEKAFSRSSRTNGRERDSKFNNTPELQKTDRHKIKDQRKSKDSIKPEKAVPSDKNIVKNERIKISTENKKPDERGKERIKENIDLSAKSNKTDFLDKKKKKKEKPVKVKGKKEKKEKEKKTKKKKDTLDVKEIKESEKQEIVEKKKTVDIDEREVASLKAKIDAIAFKQRTDVKPELKDIKLPPLQNSVKKSSEKTTTPPKRISVHTTELDKMTKEPVRAFEQADKVDEPYDPFEPTASPSLSNSSPCSSFQSHSPPSNSKRKLSSDVDSFNNSTDSAFGNVKRPKVETVKPPTETVITKPTPKAFNDILPQLATQDGSKLNQLIDKFVNKSGKATLDSKETDAEKALPGSSKFATSAKKDFKSIFNAPSPNESDSEFEFNDEEEIESSAVELQNKNSRERYLKKLHHQERVVEEVKLAIKPYYQRKEVDKHDYKEILKRSVNQVCHSKSGEINPVKIRRLIDGYVKKFQLKKKHVDKDSKDKKKPTALLTQKVKKKR